MGDITVYASPLPFSNKQVKRVALPGSTIEDIVFLITPDLHRGLGAVVTINGYHINRKHWHRVRPKEGTLVNVRIVPQGGGGKKNPIASLLSIAVMIAAPALSTAVLGSALAGTSILSVGSFSLTYGTLLSGAISMVGRLAISALAPPPKQSNAGIITNPSESPTMFIEGARNSILKYGVVPVCLGKNRMFPPQAALPYTETSGGEQYVRQLFCWGYGERLVVRDLKIGETEIAEFDEVSLSHRFQGDLHQGTSLYTDDVSQNDLSILIEQADGWTLRTTEPDVDEAIIDITFPQGLCEYNTEGARTSFQVELEWQFAETGTSNWQPTKAFKSYSGASLSVSQVPFAGTAVISGNTRYVGYRKDIVVVDKYTGVISIISGISGLNPSNAKVPTIPSSKIRLSTVVVRSMRLTSPASSPVTTSVESYTDDRSAALYGVTLQTSSDFAVSAAGSTVTVASGAISLSSQINRLYLLGSQNEALRRRVMIDFPSRGQYDVRLRRITADTNSDKIFDKAYWTALRNITHRAPVTMEGVNGTGMRIRGTEQLNGQPDQFNGEPSLVCLDYNPDSGEWVEAETSNPASIYRYVLQCAANAKPVADAGIILSDIEAWHVYCTERGYSYNRIIDFETSISEILRDVAAAGAASPARVDGKITVVVDRAKDDIVQIVTPRNSWGYRCERIYPEVPHALRVRFRNASRGYVMDERIVYAPGYDETNATLYEGIEYLSCTNSDLAYKHGSRHLAEMILRQEKHIFMMDVENLVMIRGDRIKMLHDVPVIGVGLGRIKTVADDGVNVTAFVLDEEIVIPTGGMYYARIRLADGTQLYKEITTGVGPTTSFTFATPFPLADSPAAGDLCGIVEAGGELDLIVTRIEPQADLTARITAVDYAPDVFDAETGDIPYFNSQITLPIELIRPVAPILVDDPQSDENVMLVNSDGSVTPRMIITLQNDNYGQIEPLVQVRRMGDSIFTNANLLEADPERIVLTGLDDGERYDIYIRYRRASSSMLSPPLQLNNVEFVGASEIPDDVTEFRVAISDSTAMFEWQPNDNIDLSHYIVKFSRTFSGASWETAQTLKDNIRETRITVPFIGGTYLIKAVDYLGYESANASVIITYDPSGLINAVQTIVESPSFAGVKDNVSVYSGELRLIDPVLEEGFYYFDQETDLGGVFVSQISAGILATGDTTLRIRSLDSIRGAASVRGSAPGLRSAPSIRSMRSITGVYPGTWGVELQIRTTNDDPTGAPVWSDWERFEAGSKEFWGAQYRLRLFSEFTTVTPSVSELIVNIDMPDRIVKGNDLTVTAAGVTVTYSPAFKDKPAVLISIQNAAVDDRIEFTSKTESGFSFKVYNATAAGYVTRIFDHTSIGYGRVQ